MPIGNSGTQIHIKVLWISDSYIGPLNSFV